MSEEEVQTNQPAVSQEEIDAARKAWASTAGKGWSERRVEQRPVLPRPGERNILITSALPYVNNVPHLGNIVGCVLSADVFARYCRLRGHNTLYVCGTDEYGTATEVKALQEGTTPRQTCDKYYALHDQVYRWFNIAFDYFGRTTTDKQTEISQSIFWKLHQNGFIIEESVEQLYCTTCARFLADRLVEGTCPYCSWEDARGDQCDKCGKLINAPELKLAKCKLCKTSPQLGSSKHLFLDLAKLEKEHAVWFSKITSSESCEWTTTARAITSSWLKEGLKPRCITRDLKWGTPVPLDGFQDKVFYVWFDAPIGYPSITANYTDKWELWWKNPSQVEHYEFMAKDNVLFHGIIFPACQIGTRDEWTRVSQLIAIEYLNYEDAKFSKSRGVGVFGTDASDSGIEPDIWRFYLMYIRPESQDSSFSWTDLQSRANNDLLNNLGNFVNRTLKFLWDNYEGKVPAVTLTDEDVILLAKVNRELAAYEATMSTARLRNGIIPILNISRLGNQLIQSTKPWELVKGTADQKARAGSVTGLCANLTALISLLMSPFMPDKCRELSEMLNLSANVLGSSGSAALGAIQFLALNHTINKPEPLFKKIETPLIESLRKKFSGKQAPVANGAAAGAGDSLDGLSAEELAARVTAQADKVRTLKAQKADKDLVSEQVALLLRLKEAAAKLNGPGDAPPTKEAPKPSGGGGKKKNKKK